jgi:myo-inositol 2-dehydrogenase/D-chiro-inositol 1-dehydrogenase
MPQTSPISLALVGVGRMGMTHLRALAGGAAGVEVVAVVEPSDAVVTSVPRRYHATHDLVADGGVDGVIVAVPTRLHTEVVTELLDAGIPVLCEKPCGLASDETRTLGERAQAARLPLQVGYWRRFVPALRTLREQIAAGELGSLELIHCAQWDENPPSPAFRDPASSGGILVDMGVHDLDMLRWLTGAEIGDVTGTASETEVNGDPDGAAFVVGLGGGTLALVSLLRRYPPGDLCRIEVVGTDGATSIDFVPPGDEDRAILDALREQARDFARAIRGEPTSAARAADAVAALEAAERVRAALGLIPRPAPR